MSSDFYKSIQTVFEANKNQAQANDMAAYMRNQFQFYGIKSPLRKELSKPFLKKAKDLNRNEIKDLVQQLWNQPYRELHYLAQEMYFKVAKKYISEKQDIDLLEWMVLHNSWWDTVDFIAPKLMKIYFEKFRDERNKKVDEWIESNNIWLRRSAILIHLKTKEKVDLPYAFATILRLINTNEFFINKAIGWVLREHAKKQPKKIIEFVKSHQDELSNLSKKEALKHFPEVYKEVA